MDILLPIVSYSSITNNAEEVKLGTININDMTFVSAVEDVEEINGKDVDVTILEIGNRSFVIAMPLHSFTKIRNSKVPMSIGESSAYRLLDNDVEYIKIVKGLQEQAKGTNY